MNCLTFVDDWCLDISLLDHFAVDGRPSLLPTMRTSTLLGVSNAVIPWQ